MSKMELKAGDILVADKSLGFDPDFGGSVIVLLAHGSSTVGVNVASGLITLNLFKGGPLPMPYPVALHKASDSTNTSRPVGASGYAITELDSYDNTNALMLKKPEKSAVLAGYAGWGPGQLEAEIAQGVWKKAEGLSIEELLGTWPKDRWAFATLRAEAASAGPAPKDPPAPKAAQQPKP